MDYNNQQNNYNNGQPAAPGYPQIPEEYRPISMWGYFGYELLFSIPCVGLILLIVFSVGGTKNINLKNFARSYFCLMIIVCILCIIGFLVLGSIGAATLGEMGYY